MNLDKNLFKTDYISEAREILDSLDDVAIQATKEKRNGQCLNEILRLLHTLKGSSRMMEYVQIEKVINHLETVFKNVQNNQTEISNKLIQLLMGVTNLIHKVIDDIEDGSDGTFEQYEDVLKNIDQALEDENFITDFTSDKEMSEEDKAAADEEEKNHHHYRYCPCRGRYCRRDRLFRQPPALQRGDGGARHEHLHLLLGRQQDAGRLCDGGLFAGDLHDRGRF